VFFIPLENSWSVDVQNGLAWAIWTFVAQIVVERMAGSQIGSLTPDHLKSGIDPTLMRVGEVQHTIEKLSRRATTLLQTSSRSEVEVKSYERSKSWESKSGQFWDSTLGVLGKSAI
jgi:Ni,Fe-hydrogenase I large subunit